MSIPREGDVPSEGLYIDHVIYGVTDIDAAAERLRCEHGLGSVPGGVHLGGTTNRVVPLAPPVFLELLGVGDPALAEATDRVVGQTVGGGPEVRQGLGRPAAQEEGEPPGAVEERVVGRRPQELLQLGAQAPHVGLDGPELQHQVDEDARVEGDPVHLPEQGARLGGALLEAEQVDEPLAGLEGARVGALAGRMGLSDFVHKARRPAEGVRVGTLRLRPAGAAR